jgi:hypothetical protein
MDALMDASELDIEGREFQPEPVNAKIAQTFLNSNPPPPRRQGDKLAMKSLFTLIV